MQNFILFLTEYIICMFTHHVFLFHSAVHGHLDCFYILAIVNNVAIKLGCMDIFELVVLLFSDIYPGVELPGHR